MNTALYIIEAFYVDPEGLHTFTGVKGTWMPLVHLEPSRTRAQGLIRRDKQQERVPNYPLRLVRFVAEGVCQ